MKKHLAVLFITLLLAVSCKKGQSLNTPPATAVTNTVKYAGGLQIYRYTGYSIIKVTQPWPGADKKYTYIIQKKDAEIPDSLKQYTTIQLPLKNIIVTSTTHIPSLEMLGVEPTLKGFPGTDYVSSEKTRKLIDTGHITEVGANESLNTEVIIDLDPDVIVAFAVDGSNKSLAALERSGLKVLYNGDWTEQSPLGKAEWIKFFGVLYGMEDKADSIFSGIESEYLTAKKLAENTTTKPTVLAGAIYQDQWYLPQGNSWGALFIKDAGGHYLWDDTQGTGSLNLSFETVLDKAQNADFWIGPGQFTSFSEMEENNPHYNQFKAFKSRNVYSYSIKKGATGGLLYYELAPNRPDLVLKDLIHILHPELLPNWKNRFFDQLN
ncbi:ABC transporter substrate-binding protein [Flavobacterium rhizosphaerae]|uniref:ABC transporter substrate-binding protein n=1 Tax=Flavobacterium rhizosphaerae TaxID=3163298 RepID=A0ABW8YWW6_9FLAO